MQPTGSELCAESQSRAFKLADALTYRHSVSHQMLNSSDSYSIADDMATFDTNANTGGMDGSIRFPEELARVEVRAVPSTKAALGLT